MYRMTVRVKGTENIKKMEGDFRRMTKKGAEQVAKKLVDLLQLEIQQYNLVWLGTLFDSIEVVPQGRTQFGVGMAGYGEQFERDRELNTVTPELRAWAHDPAKGLWNPERFLKIVRTRGHTVQARPFVTEAINNVQKQATKIMLQNLRRK